MYDFDVEKLVTTLLPSFLKKARLIAFVKVFVSPLTELYTTFLSEKKSMLGEAYMTGQVAKLEGLLNAKFDPTQVRVKLVHPESFVVIISNARSFLLYDNLHITLGDDIGDSVNFHVNIPLDFARHYQTILPDLFDNGRPFFLSDRDVVLVSDLNFVTIEDLFDSSIPLLVSDSSFFVLHDLDDVGSVIQIKQTIEKYKLAGKTFSLSI